MTLNNIGRTLLDETSSHEAVREAIDSFVQSCAEVTGIQPDPSFDAWANDSMLDNGVAINPQAAAHCALDHQRSVVFIRGVNAAIIELKTRFPSAPLEILYAGCGPFATLLLPLLGFFTPGDLKLNFLDIHQESLDSVELLLKHFGFSSHNVQAIQGDASKYQHLGKLDLVIAETMQKSLEQEPQFAVTANLAPQISHKGIFIPQRIDVALHLCDTDVRHSRHLLTKIFTLSTESALTQMKPNVVTVPRLPDLDRFDAALFTRICVFEQYCLNDYESQITLPQKCHELLPLTGGAQYKVSYQLGSYPKFNFERLGVI